MNRESERKRLVELIDKAHMDYLSYATEMGLAGNYDGVGTFGEFASKRLLATGIVVPPCKVGDKLYFVYENNIYDMTVEKIVMKEAGLFLVDKGFNDWYSVKEIGKTLYLTREEAEKMLKGREDGN